MKKNKEQIKKDIVRIILISKNYYDLWSKFWDLRAPNVVGLDQAKLNVKIYKDFGQLFTVIEEASLTSFSVIFSQLFDVSNDSVSLYALDSVYGSKFKTEIDNLKENKTIKKGVSILRRKSFAHRDINDEYDKRIVPASKDIEEVFDSIMKLVEKITGIKNMFVSSSGDELEGLFHIIQKSNPRRFKI